MYRLSQRSRGTQFTVLLTTSWPTKCRVDFSMYLGTPGSLGSRGEMAKVVLCYQSCSLPARGSESLSLHTSPNTGVGSNAVWIDGPAQAWPRFVLSHFGGSADDAVPVSTGKTRSQKRL